MIRLRFSDVRYWSIFSRSDWPSCLFQRASAFEHGVDQLQTLLQLIALLLERKRDRCGNRRSNTMRGLFSAGIGLPSML